MSLSFISAGINFDLTLNGIDELKKCEEVYAEIYTSPIQEKEVKNLEEKLNKKIKIIERDGVESNLLIERAKEKEIGLVVVGDALIATTHISLLIECRRKNIKTKVIHNSSIFCAATGKSGLSPYRFGKSATLPYWRKNYEPTSPLECVEENLKRNLHTILFLDLDSKMGPMDANKGIEMIRKIEEKLGRGIVKKAIILSRIGYEDEKITYGFLDKLEKSILGKPLFTFIVPAKLHIIEEEYLEFFKIQK
ncbi:MAG: diphthine synthase [Candidatus Micrarchaeia archaeon]